VEGNGSDVVYALAFHCFSVQALDIAQCVLEVEAGRADFVSRQPVEHEGIIGVGTVRNCDFASLRRSGVRRNLLDSNRGHECALWVRYQPAAIPAADMILITSAKTNQ